MKGSLLACALMASLACTACSQGPQAPAATPPVSAASAASQPQATPEAPATATTTASVGDAGEAQVYLFDLLQRPDFAKALQALPGAQALPDWVGKGGTATPVQTVQVDGKPMLLASACKPHNCPSERVALLYDSQNHAMWGLFAQRPDSVPATVDPADDSRDKLSWLGAPDAPRKALLHEALYTH